MWVLMFSRSRKHGLRSHQPHLKISLGRDGGMTVLYHQPPEPIIEITLRQVELTPEVEALFQRLAARPVD